MFIYTYIIYIYIFTAEFMYQRDNRDNPSLNSYLTQRDEPHKTFRSEDKSSSTMKSPLAVTSLSSTTANTDIGV